jgi:hypothetical protein
MRDARRYGAVIVAQAVQRRMHVEPARKSVDRLQISE